MAMGDPTDLVKKIKYFSQLFKLFCVDCSESNLLFSLLGDIMNNQLSKELNKAKLRLTFTELSDSEFNIAFFYSCGISHKEISKICALSTKSIDNYLQKIKDKLNLTKCEEIRLIILIRLLTL
ncbi:hypothetical protein H3N34_18045 [Photobacterium damselae subsp. damselae]|uniref:LuxR C-terminal-related transcriptional regulator n=1 Tax=Photobacterium damselae TaxID=38293 RepID=UPI0010FDA83D|nr:hypothetical protein [Photobacterium damselae]MBA5685073.1 hypothetical protein [Photobacterium damselae subsp. damselae]TLS66834.1 hypothetical protein FD718_16750 [Photobacterium damselae subsp. damselae]